MREYKIYKPTPEAVKELKDQYKRYNGAFSDYETNLLIMCLIPQDNNSTYDFSKTLIGIRYNLMGIADKIRYDVRNSALKQFEAEREMEFPCQDYNDDSQDSIISKTVKELAVLALAVNTPNYFEKDSNFYEKRTAIEENIDYFKEEMTELANKELMEFFKDYEVKYEDEDDDF